MTIPDLAQLGSHNKREKRAYQLNKDLKIKLSKNNIELVPLNIKYVKGFDELTKEYKNQNLNYENRSLIYRLKEVFKKIITTRQ